MRNVTSGSPRPASLPPFTAAARVLRAQTLSLRNRDYVAAARVSGEKTWRVICVEILPNLLPLLASQFVFAVVLAILSEAGLSFLGEAQIQRAEKDTKIVVHEVAPALAGGSDADLGPRGGRA